jgi:hypothetical protein
MAVKTYMDLIDEMKALADKINKHYDSVTLETEIPIEDEKTRILREAGIIEDDNETPEDESPVAEETEAQSDEEEAIEEDVESTEEDEKDWIMDEGHSRLPAMDAERYGERSGLEGPMRARNGKVVYYDPKEGQYYDPDTDIYISNDDWEKMNEVNIREQLDIIGVENDEHVNVIGTGRRGEIKARYDDLVRIFGEPTKSKERGDQMDKTNAEWYLEFEVRDEDDPEDTDYIVATIYDWKYPELPLDKVQWNIGGKTWKSYEAVTDYIDNHGATTESDEGPELQRLMKLAGTK